ncbi:hypothetical protein I316_03120 [Kwoniella heveanensis BCC8398]|uniref:MADS-box domain-containing protein n=1 Tax=Kwoniella heveanensis BCC8398 TaxID=1296120 RepID=A0A1B9GVL9_9TREE|nr:hypothetical protein I316_03120 [Kwoniella heveanensis BCC8398]
MDPSLTTSTHVKPSHADDPFAPRLTPTFSATLAPPTPTSQTTQSLHTPRSVSINMEDYMTDGTKDEQELDLNMVHDFGGEGLGVDMRDFTHHGDENDHEHDQDHEIGGRDHEHEAVIVDSKDGMLGVGGPATGDIPSSTAAEMDDMFQAETGLDGDDEDDDDGDMTEGPSTKRSRSNGADGPSGFTYVEKDGEPSRRKIRIEYISDKSRRHITFSKRKAGIMKKAYELSILTGTQVLLLVVSETGLVYTFTTTKLQPLVQKSEGKNLIQACLNAPDGFGPDGQPLTGPVSATKAKNGGLAIRPHKLTAAASAAMAASAQAASEEQASNAAAQAANQAQAHANAQAEAAASVGQGTPVAARPKKRLPSSKKRQASNAAAQPPPELDIPPVPTIPDIHRQASPHNPHPSSGGLTIDPSLHSPMSAGFQIPPEYQQHHPHAHQHHQPPPNQQHQQQQQQHYAYPPPTGPEGYGYYAPPPPHGHGHQYMTLHHQQQQMFQQQQQQRERERMMGMGM